MRKRRIPLRPAFVFEGSTKARVVVFVHGIFGDTFGTWTHRNGQSFFGLMKADSEAFGDVSVFVYGFPSSYWKESFDITQAVNDLKGQLQSFGVLQYQQIVFVGHSMGGLIAMELLLTHPDVAAKVPFMFFYSTPWEGSAITEFARNILNNPGLDAMLPNNEFLQSLDNRWRNARDSGQLHTKILCAVEANQTFGYLVVTWASGTRLCDGAATPVAADHIQIVKPEGPTNAAYQAFRRALGDAFGKRPADAASAPADEALAPIQRLCLVEKKLARPIRSGQPARFGTLLDYYREANPELFGEFDRIIANQPNDAMPTGATFVLGAAGIGKSFVRRALLSRASDSCTVELSRLFGKDAAARAALGITAVPDLMTSDGRVFNELPGLGDPSRFGVAQLETLPALTRCQPAARRRLLVLDDVDEVDPRSAAAILRAVEDVISEGGPRHRMFSHFVVFGRPEGFSAWLRDPHRVPPSHVRTFTLEGPSFQTTGDLEIAAREYLAFSRQPAGLHDLAIPRYTRLVLDHGFLTYSTRILVANNFLVEHAIVQPVHTARSLRDALYDNLVDRNRDTHGRPASRALEYGQVLEDIAAKYAGAIDDEGFFAVRAEDTVPVGDRKQGHTVHVRSVLDRSGIAFLRPADFRSAKYRFEPFWIHGYLVERRNARMAPQSPPEACRAG